MYDEIILDHIKNVRNYGELGEASRRAEGLSPLCGDELTVFVKIGEDSIDDVSFVCSCCGIAMASASVMTESVKGKNVAAAKALALEFVALSPRAQETVPPADPGWRAVFETVREFPGRAGCAALAWHTLAAALDGRAQVFAPVSPRA